MSFYAPKRTLDQIYKIFARPHLDYCDIIYHLPSLTNPSANLAVLGAWKGSSKINMYEELGWESLSDRRWFRRLCQFYKIQNDLTPLYLKEAIPQPRTFLYGQRRENELHEIPCRTTRFFNSFYPDTTPILPDHGITSDLG